MDTPSDASTSAQEALGHGMWRSSTTTNAVLLRSSPILDDRTKPDFAAEYAQHLLPYAGVS